MFVIKAIIEGKVSTKSRQFLITFGVLMLVPMVNLKTIPVPNSFFFSEFGILFLYEALHILTTYWVDIANSQKIESNGI